MKKVAENMVSEQHKPATPEQIQEYKKLKARNEWIEFNRKQLDQIEHRRLFAVKLVTVISAINLIVSLINLLL